MENKIAKVDRSHPAFRENAEPFYQIIMEGIKGEVDGEKQDRKIIYWRDYMDTMVVITANTPD
ncbi:MAG: hypothetical protein ACN6ON_11010 [Sphingobacterium sp.]